MNIKTFWTIFLKIFGLYLIWQLLLIIPSMASSIALETQIKVLSFIPMVVESAFMICLFIVFFYCCLFKTDWLIKKLKLDDGFTDDLIKVNGHRSDLLKIAVIVLGGLMITDGLPSLFFNILKYLEHSNQESTESLISPPIISNLLRVILGYFMIADSAVIVNFIERRRKKAAVEPELYGEEKDELK